VAGPRLFLVPQWTDDERTIRPLLEELDGLGWDGYFIVGDSLREFCDG
jgi:hypothetical protein